MSSRKADQPNEGYSLKFQWLNYVNTNNHILTLLNILG